MRRILFSTLVSGVAAILLSTQVMAADWIVRGRGIIVSPDASSSGVLSQLDAESNFTAEIDITRFLSPNWGLELILATTTHEITSAGSSLGSVTLLPPTLTLQYHFSPNGNVRPYAGIGINYTTFYDESGALDGVDLDNSFGLAAQFGIDWMVSKQASFNIDIKYINIETEATAGGVKLADIEINPWVIGIGAGIFF